MLNKIILKGNLGRDPEIQVTKAGKKIAKFSLATSVSWRDEANEWREHTNWHRIVVFRESTARWIEDVLKKGDTIYVEGTLNYHLWKGKDGHSHRVTHIVVSGQDGRVEYIRSKKSQLQETTDMSGFNSIPETLPLEKLTSENLNPEDFSGESLNAEDFDLEDLFFQSHQKNQSIH